MFPQLFDAPSMASTAANTNPLRHHTKTMSTIITKEIHSDPASSSAKQSHGIATRRWFKGKDHEHYMVQYNREFAEKKKTFTAADMAEVHGEYLRETEVRERRLEEEKWRVICRLERTLKEPRYCRLRLAQGDRALYESMFKMEPRKYISRPKFLTTMRLVYGFELANLSAVSNSEMLGHLNGLYTSFDTGGRDEMDWRCFLLMLCMCHDKTATVMDHVKWGYSLYSSQGSFDDPTGRMEEPMRLGDVKDLLGTMVRAVYRRDVVEVTDKAWAALAGGDGQGSKEAKAIVRKVEKTEGKSMDDVKIPYNLFEQMLQQPTLAPLFETHRTWGKKDSGTWTYEMEERYYHPALLKFIMAERRENKTDDLADLFVLEKSKRRKRDAVSGWRRYLFRRKRARYLMTENIVRYVVDNTATAWVIFRKFAMREIAVREIQRTARGYAGRTEASFLAVLNRSCTLLQSVYRGKLARRKFLGVRKKRMWAAAEVQRHVRGGLARRLALKRLEGRLEEGREVLRRDRCVVCVCVWGGLFFPAVFLLLRGVLSPLRPFPPSFLF